MTYPPLPDKIEQTIARARRLEWCTLGVLSVIVVLMYLVMGSSQAMQTAWVEDVLSMLAPALFLGTTAIERRAPTAKYPFGFHRVQSLAFLVAAVALLGIGGFLVYEAAHALITVHHPTITSVSMLGREIWMGWLMIGVLAFSVIGPMILGRMKLKLAEEVHDKVLFTDAETNKADWQTGIAGMVGVLGIAWGFWWADAVAAGLIALSIVLDGARSCRLAVAELLDGAPREIDSPEIEDAAEHLRRELERQFPGSMIRMRETGRYLRAVVGTGEPIDPEHGDRLLGDRAWRLIEISRSIRAEGDGDGVLDPGPEGTRRGAEQR
jgi:cation diffusion facilitator family transporter